MAGPPKFTLRQLRAFREAYRLRNLTHAAEALHMTQSAMSALIRQFEGALGVTLFERTSRSLRPTKAADEAYAQIQVILDKVVGLGSSMQRCAENAQSVLAFSCAPALASAVVPTVLASFKAKYPHVATTMYDAFDNTLIQRVSDEEVEFSIGFFEHEPDAVTRSALLVDHLYVVCKEGSPLAHKKRVVWEDLTGLPIINLSRGAEVQQLIAEALANAGKTYRPAYTISFIHTALAMASQGLGLVVMPGYLVKGNPHVTSLVAQKLHDPIIERSLLIHTRQGHTLSSTATEFLNMLRKHLLSLT